MGGKSAILTIVDNDNPIIGAEVGVWKGSLSNGLLTKLPLLTLHMIDLWQPWTPKDKAYSSAVDIMCRTPTDEFERVYQDVLTMACSFGNRAVVHRGDSVLVAGSYPDDYFDFVFIDAEHSEAALTLDLAAWWPKVKPDGHLCGHDFGKPRFPGVAIAVYKFLNAKELKQVTLKQSCWFIRKEI